MMGSRDTLILVPAWSKFKLSGPVHRQELKYVDTPVVWRPYVQSLVWAKYGIDMDLDSLLEEGFRKGSYKVDKVDRETASLTLVASCEDFGTREQHMDTTAFIIQDLMLFTRLI